MAGTKLIKTTQDICKKCKYHYGGDNALIICDYLEKTGNRRNCPVGVCNKFEPIHRKGGSKSNG